MDLLVWEPPSGFLEAPAWQVVSSDINLVGELSLEAVRRLVAPRFEIRAAIGSGGFGSVFAAYDRHQEATVALKALYLTGTEAIARLRREFRALADWNHPNLVRMYEFFAEADGCFITMELIEGEDFVTAARGQPGQLRELLLQLVRAISSLHQAGLLHCDLKPSNVLVTPANRVVVLDFGLVTEASGGTVLFGTPAYMSPEQKAAVSLTPASDWYSIGVMLYEALTGSQFFGNPGLLPIVREPDLSRLCIDLLDPNPSSRPSADEIIERLGSTASLKATEPREVFVGRNAELTALGLAFEAARSHPVAQRVIGPPGIGKSSLARKFLSQIDGTALYTVCRERESVPFKAFDDAVGELDRYSRNTDPLIGGDRSLVTALFPQMKVDETPRRPHSNRIATNRSMRSSVCSDAGVPRPGSCYGSTMRNGAIVTVPI
jgi:serine/threonine protein kinase